MNEEMIKKAIAKLGGETAAARHLTEVSGIRCTRDMVSGWKTKIGVPARWALWVEQETGISRHLLCNTPLPLERLCRDAESIRTS